MNDNLGRAIIGVYPDFEAAMAAKASMIGQYRFMSMHAQPGPEDTIGPVELLGHHHTCVCQWCDDATVKGKTS